MADLVFVLKSISQAEKRIYDFDFNPDIRGTVTVTGATATLEDPFGVITSSGVIVGTIVGNVVPVQIGPVTSGVGRYFLECRASLSDGEISVLRGAIDCIY